VGTPSDRPTDPDAVPDQPDPAGAGAPSDGPAAGLEHGPDEHHAPPGVAGPARLTTGPADATAAAAAPSQRRPLGRPLARQRWRPHGWTSGWALPIGAGVAGGLLAAQAIAAVFTELRTIITILVVSAFLSFAMEPGVQWLARRGLRRGAGTGLVFLAALIVFGGFLAAMLPVVIEQGQNLLLTLPSVLGDLSTNLENLLPGDAGEATASVVDDLRRGLAGMSGDLASGLGRGAIDIGQSVIGGLFILATIGLVTFYLVADGPRLRLRLASRMAPRDQVRVLGLWELAIAKTGGYVYSRALTAIVSAVFHIVVFLALGLDYAVALGVWVGLISSLIPAIGTYLAGALPLLVALASSPSLALWVLVAITAYQQVENYIIVPRITASTMELHPAVAFLSVIAGAALAGATGALLAIPAVAIATALLGAAAEEYDVLEHHLIETGPAAAAELIDEAGSLAQDEADD
jgi:predicted PurR-regulated permease PerM